MKNVPSELTGWNEIIEKAGRDNSPNQSQAQAEAIQKQVLALVNLSNAVFNAQRHIADRLDTLNDRLAESSNSQDKLGNKTFWLTVALVIATIVQAGAAVIVATND